MRLKHFSHVQVYSLEDGPARDVWKNLGFPVNIMQSIDTTDIGIDWLK